MIVWDSREAKERNARGRLAECNKRLGKAQWRALRVRAMALYAAALLLFEMWQLALHPGVLPVLGLLAAVGVLMCWAGARRDAYRNLSDCLAPLDVARANYDRVFGEQR